MANNTQLAGKKVFLVEDDMFFTDLISQKLTSSECVFSHVGTGEDALSALEKDIPDVVLLDIMLPGKIDGFGVLEKMKGDSKLKDVPVILLSNLSSLQDIERGMKLGAFRYLVKASIFPSEIVDHIAAVFTTKKK